MKISVHKHYVPILIYDFISQSQTPDMIQEAIIVPSCSPWESLVVLVPRKDTLCGTLLIPHMKLVSWRHHGCLRLDWRLHILNKQLLKTWDTEFEKDAGTDWEEPSLTLTC